jgi:hypothetical protein
MKASNRLLTDVDRNWVTSRGEEEKRAPWRGYNKRSGSGWYLDTPRKDEHRSDTLTFPSTTIDNISKVDELGAAVSSFFNMSREPGNDYEVRLLIIKIENLAADLSERRLAQSSKKTADWKRLIENAIEQLQRVKR